MSRGLLKTSIGLAVLPHFILASSTSRPRGERFILTALSGGNLYYGSYYSHNTTKMIPNTYVHISRSIRHKC